MAITQITDHATRAATALIEQYKDKPKVVGLLTAFVNQVQKGEDGLFPTLFLPKLGVVNLAPDSSFESDSNNDGMSDGWALYNNGPEAATLSRVAGGMFGTWAQRAAWSVTNTSTKGIFTDTTLPGGGIQWRANRSYVGSWYSRATGTAVGQKMQTAWNFAPTVTELLNPPLTADYQRYAWKLTWGGSVPGDPGTSALRGEIYASVLFGAACTGTVDFDGMLITEGTDLLDYNTTGANLDIIGRVLGEPRLGRNDLSYRTALQARILLNRSSGSIEELYAIFALLLSVNGLSATMQVVEHYPKAFDLVLHGAAVPDAIAADLAAILKKAKDAGARAYLEYGNTTPFFGFEGASGFDTGYFGGSL